MTKAKKSLGQHFLTNPQTAEKIAAAINPDIETIIEVGPGRGILTQFVVDKANKVFLIEKDDELAELMRQRYADRQNVQVVHDDFLRTSLADMSNDNNTCLVGNFPYNISSQIFFKMLENRQLISEMVGMFQLEVAKRIVAGPGSKEYGILSVLAQASYDGKLIMHIAPGQFNPPPKVKSAVIRLVRKENFEPPCSYYWLRRVVKTSFNQRRKMLRNTMRDIVDADILKSDTLFQKRPEQLNIHDFYRIANLAEANNQ